MKIALVSLLAIASSVSSSSAQIGSSGWNPRDVPYTGAITVDVNATDIERGIFHVSETIPVARAGRLTLLFPKWVPGNHAPTARIERLAGLFIRSGDMRIHWSRDPVDMNAFHIDVPRAAPAISLEFDYLSATSSSDGRVVMTPEMLNVQWFSLVLYPAGYYARKIVVHPRIRIPDGWQFTTQLDATSRSGSTITFKPVSLETLMDSPIFAGRNFRTFDLGAVEGATVSLDVVADDPKYLDAAPGAIDAHRRLVAEAGKVFGRPPFRRYRFMLALTKEMGGIGTEHLASSENTRPVEYLSDWQWSALLPHELAHAWNGKSKRPRDLWSADFNAPMRNSMLWVYEGQTQFWGFVLAARSGLMTREQVLDAFARLAASQAVEPGRRWRPLIDTGNDAIMTRELIDEPWPAWHRSLSDSYSEGDLIWIEVDGLIRELSHEKRSLDDFARTFFAGGAERASLYDLNDVITALNRVQPYDWSTFLNQRLDSTDAPGDWLRRSGYRLVFADAPTEAFTEHERRANRTDLTYTLGIMLRGGVSGEVSDVRWNSVAFTVGIVPGARVISVNGAAYTPAGLRDAISANRDGRHPIELVVEQRNRTRAFAIDYRGGLQFPKLERVPGVRDRLTALLESRR